MTEDEMKAEIAYLEKRHREECSILATERDVWRAKYDEILNYLSRQVREKNAVRALAIYREREEAEKKPKTNGDRIRQMADDELAEWFAPYILCNLCYKNKKDRLHGCKLNDCKKSALAYIKKEVSENAEKD